MKRLTVILLTLPLAACVSSRSFDDQDGVCYRTQTDKIFWVIPIGQSEVQSVASNCGE